MPKIAIPLTEKQVDELAPRQVRYKLSDGLGLYLLVMPTGKKFWRMDFKLLGKQSTLSCGIYPAVSLEEARIQCRAARQLISEGKNPVEIKREPAREIRPPKAKTPLLRLSMSSSGSLTIEKTSNRLILSPAQVDALRAFLTATVAEGE